MKKCSLFFTALLLCGLPVVTNAASLPEGAYKCKSEDLDNNLKTAKYIVVAKLEKYLDNHLGEYRVLMNLRGEILPNEIIVDFANRFDPALNSGGIPLGTSMVFLGEKIERQEQYTRFWHYECYGYVGTQYGGGNPKTIPLFNSIIEYILEQEQ